MKERKRRRGKEGERVMGREREMEREIRRNVKIESERTKEVMEKQDTFMQVNSLHTIEHKHVPDIVLLIVSVFPMSHLLFFAHKNGILNSVKK